MSTSLGNALCQRNVLIPTCDTCCAPILCAVATPTRNERKRKLERKKKGNGSAQNEIKIRRKNNFKSKLRVGTISL